MKTRKNKITSLLKTGILFLGISILLWNCEQETLLEQPTNEVQLSKLLQNSFNANDFKETIPYEYEVDWSNPKKQYSEQLESNFYEFSILYSNTFNPDVFNAQNKREFYEKYKVVITENEEGQYNYYIAKYFLKNSEGNIDIDYNRLSIYLDKGYDGTVHLYNNLNEMLFAKHVSSSEKLEDYYLKSNSTLPSSDEFEKRWVTECEITPIYYYKDWYYITYDRFGQITSSTYSHTTLVGTSEKRVCNRRWIHNINVAGENICNGPKCPIYDVTPAIICPIGFEGDKYGKCVKINEDQIFNELTGKAKCVYDKLQELSTGFKNAIKKFDGDFPVAHLKFSIDNNLPDSTNAVTDNSGQHLIEISFNGNTMNQRTILGLVRTFAHETIHAELFRKVRSVNSHISINDFPGIYDYYRRYIKNWQHQQMAAHYRETIVDILKEFDGNQHSNQFYMDLAWEGLHGTVAWNNLSSFERTRITYVVNNYKSTGNKNCN